MVRPRGSGEKPARKTRAQDQEPTGAAAAGGPYDAADFPAGDGAAFFDLGALRLPDIAGIDIEFPRDSPSPPTSVIVRAGEVAMGLTVFAAPKSRGLWNEVRAQLAHDAGAGTVVTAGRYGPELRLPGRRKVIGIDGPRWFLRVVVAPIGSLRTVRPAKAVADGSGGAVPAHGAGAAPDSQDSQDNQADPTCSPTGSAVLDEVLDGLVVMRGRAAMPPGAALPLRPPGGPERNPAGADPVRVELLHPTGTGTAEALHASHELAPPVTAWLSRDLTTGG